MSDILIVDDHPIVREGMAQLVEQKFGGRHKVTGQADNADEALDKLTLLRPDMVIVDIFLKGSDGIELVKRIRSKDPDINILVLSMHDESLYAGRAIAAGAQGYVMKQEEPEEIIKAIDQILQGKVYLSGRMATSLLRNRATNTDKGLSLISLMTDRELEVFRLFGTGWTTRKIAKHLHLSVKTIETYCARIKEKLELENVNELIQRAVQWVNSKDFG